MQIAVAARRPPAISPGGSFLVVRYQGVHVVHDRFWREGMMTHTNAQCEDQAPIVLWKNWTRQPAICVFVGVTSLMNSSCSDSPEKLPDSAGSPPLLAHDIDARRTHVCAAALDGNVWCWGRTSGELSYRLPTRINGVPASTRVSNSDFDACAWSPGEGLWCWGEVTARYVEMDGANVDARTPVKMKNLSSVVAAAGDGQSLNAVDDAGRFWGWGSARMVSSRWIHCRRTRARRSRRTWKLRAGARPDAPTPAWLRAPAQFNALAPWLRGFPLARRAEARPRFRI